MLITQNDVAALATFEFCHSASNGLDDFKSFFGVGYPEIVALQPVRKIVGDNGHEKKNDEANEDAARGESIDRPGKPTFRMDKSKQADSQQQKAESGMN